jgi:hypothetical protein
MQRHKTCIVHRATYCASHAARHKRRPIEDWSTHERPDLPCTHRLGCMRTSSLSKTLPRRKVSRNFQETFRKLAESLQKTCSAQTSLSCKLRSSTGGPVRASPPSGRQARARADRSHARQVPGSSHRVTRGARRHMGSDAPDEYRTVRPHAAGSRRMKTRRTRT